MPTYEVSQPYYFRENGQKLYPGDRIELTEEQAGEHNRNNPGLLKLARKTAQGDIATVRSEDDAPEKKTRGRRPRTQK